MILIINNNCRERYSGTTLKIYHIITHLCKSQKCMLINTHNEMNSIISDVSKRKMIKGIILTGSQMRLPHKNYVDRIFHNFLPMLELDVPVLAICFGFQLLCSMYQSNIYSFKSMLKGHKKVTIKRDKLFRGFSGDKTVYVLHNDYTYEEPLLFKTLARDSKGIIYAMKHKYKDVYGVQFHPEFSNYGNSDGIKIFKNFLDICKVRHRDLEYDDIPEVKHTNCDKMIEK